MIFMKTLYTKQYYLLQYLHEHTQIYLSLFGCKFVYDLTVYGCKPPSGFGVTRCSEAQPESLLVGYKSATAY